MIDFDLDAVDARHDQAVLVGRKLVDDVCPSTADLAKLFACCSDIPEVLAYASGLERRLREAEHSDSKDDILLSDGTHLYWSTHCRHERHSKCAETELAPGVPRKPSQCKTCEAPCICECHKDG